MHHNDKGVYMLLLVVRKVLHMSKKSTGKWKKSPPAKNVLARACLVITPLYSVHTHCWFWCTGEIFSAVGYSVTDTRDILTGRVSFVPSGGIRGMGGEGRGIFQFPWCNQVK